MLGTPHRGPPPRSPKHKSLMNDERTLYPGAENVDSGAVRMVSLCFGVCGAIWFCLFYIVLSLAIVPEIGHGDWQEVRCRVTQAQLGEGPSEMCPQGVGGKTGNVKCDVEHDPLAPAPGGKWGDRCQDVVAPGGGTCIRHVWVNALLEWQPPRDQHHKVKVNVDRMAERFDGIAKEGMNRVKRAAGKRQADGGGGQRQKNEKILSICFPYRCNSQEATSASSAASAASVSGVRPKDFRKAAEERAATLIGLLRNRSAVMPAGYYAGQRLEEPEEERGEEAERQQLDERWGRTRCQYSGPFYSSLPNIHQRHAAAAVYLKAPTGYVDLPGGVTWSALALVVLTGGCTACQLGCLAWQCRNYLFARSKRRNSRHIL